MPKTSPKHLIPTTKNVKTVTDMRERPLELIDSVKDSGPTYIFHHSEPKMIMLSTKEYHALLERIDDLEEQLLAVRLHNEALTTPVEDLIPLDKIIEEFGK